MTRHLLLIFLFLSGLCSAQTINPQELVGQWVRIYDKDEFGKKIEVNNENIDTLNFFADNRFLKKQNGTQETATWIMDSKTKTIQYKNLVYKGLILGQYIQLDPTDSRADIGILTKDTLTILQCWETDPPSHCTSWYYIRTK